MPCFLDLPGCRPGSRFALRAADGHAADGDPGQHVESQLPLHRAAPARSAQRRRAARLALRPRPVRHAAARSTRASSRTSPTSRTSSSAPRTGSACRPPTRRASRRSSATSRSSRRSSSTCRASRCSPTASSRASQLHVPRPAAGPPGRASRRRPPRSAGRSTATRLYYDGNSQGGIIGGALMALEPDAEHGVLGVPGMNYSTLLNRSTDFELIPDRPCPGLLAGGVRARQPGERPRRDELLLRLPAVRGLSERGRAPADLRPDAAAVGPRARPTATRCT